MGLSLGFCRTTAGRGCAGPKSSWWEGHKATSGHLRGLPPPPPHMSLARAMILIFGGEQRRGVPWGGDYNRSGCDPPPSYLSKLAGGGGGRREGRGGVLAARPGGGGGLRATHYYHMHTSSVCVCVCLGAWGYRGMYAIIAISRLCQEESLQGLKDQRHSTRFN